MAGNQAVELSLIISFKESVGSVSGGVPCVSAPLGGTIEPFAAVGSDAQKRGEKREEKRDKTP